MSLHRIPTRRVWVKPARATARRLTSGAARLVLLLLTACGGDASGPNGGGERTATLTGTVRAAAATALANALISIGTLQATSDANGQFELTDVPIGTATVRATLAGYQTTEEAITITAGTNTHDIELTPQEIYVFGTNAVYAPAGVGPLRGAIVVLGGPVASGFVTGEALTAGPPELEASLQALGAGLRFLARSAHVALLGSKTTGMLSNATNDNELLAALGSASQMSGHPELAEAPMLMFGLSGGGPEAAGLVSRHSDRAIGLLVRVPTEVTPLTDPAALAVPTFVMQAELDEVVDNAAVQAVFAVNRSRGGLWALAVEPEVGHHVASNKGNAAALDWITGALGLRLPGTPGDPPTALDEPSGWLGNQTTLEIASWADYPDDRTAASWLLSQSGATSWKDLGTPPDQSPQ